MGLLQGDPIFFSVCVTDVRDVGEAHILAARKGISGRRYLATGEAVTPRQTRETFKRRAGITPPTFRPPRFLASFLAGRMERAAARTGTDANLTRAMVAENFDKHLVYDSSRIERELGATFRPAEDTLRDAIRWLLFIGALRPKIANKVRRAMGTAAREEDDWKK